MMGDERRKQWITILESIIPTCCTASPPSRLQSTDSSVRVRARQVAKHPSVACLLEALENPATLPNKAAEMDFAANFGTQEVTTRC